MRVLIVGDKEEERAILREALDRLGYQHKECEEGASGWDTIQSWCPDLVLSDYIMPGLNGRELCRKVREHNWDHYVYFVVLSTLHKRDHVIEGLRSGADAYLPKPVDTEALEARLTAARRVTELHKAVANQRNELERLNGQLRDESRRDPLTGVGNRLRLNDDMVGYLDSHRRYQHQFCLALCDIDYFKQYNDTYGHLLGDRVLRQVARVLQSGTRGSDTVYRFGGEEFLVVFRQTDLETARKACERLRKALEAAAIEHLGNPGVNVLTITFGLAELRADGELPVESVLKRADEALYHGKFSGRNRVVVETDLKEAAHE